MQRQGCETSDQLTRNHQRQFGNTLPILRSFSLVKSLNQSHHEGARSQGSPAHHGLRATDNQTITSPHDALCSVRPGQSYSGLNNYLVGVRHVTNKVWVILHKSHPARGPQDAHTSHLGRGHTWHGAGWPGTTSKPEPSWQTCLV